VVGNASDPRAKEVSGEMTDDTAHLIKEYRANAARMRAQANSVRGPTEREQFEQIARDLDHLADYLVSLSTAATQKCQRT
jgi:hypothetical protein